MGIESDPHPGLATSVRIIFLVDVKEEVYQNNFKNS